MSRTLQSGLESLPGRDRLRKAIEDRVAIDSRTLAIFRIFVGVLALADLFARSRNFHRFYTEAGLAPQWLAMEMTPDYAFSFYYLTTDTSLIAALFVIQGLFALQLIVGYKTRLATVMTFLFVVSLDHHNPLVTSYADTLFRLLLFWAIFLPLGERFSIDAVHRDRAPRDRIASVASFAILAQMVVMYVVNGYHKTKEELWLSGEAAPLVFGLDDMTFLLAEPLRQFPALLLLGGLAWFYMLLLGWMLLLLKGRARLLFASAFFFAHLSFALTVRIGAFGYVGMAGVLLFFQGVLWEDTKRVLRVAGADLAPIDRFRQRVAGAARSIPDYRFDSDRQRRAKRLSYQFALAVVVIAILLVAAGGLLQFGGVASEDLNHDREIQRVAISLNIYQPSWTVFAPTPRTFDRYYVFPAKTEDGELIDVYSERPLAYDRPYEELQRQYGTYRERFYMNSVRRSAPDGPVPEVLAEHLCETWAEEHETNLTHINMYMFREYVTMDTIDAPEDRERDQRMLYRHGCGDHDPETFAHPD